MFDHIHLRCDFGAMLHLSKKSHRCVCTEYQLNHIILLSRENWINPRYTFRHKLNIQISPKTCFEPIESSQYWSEVVLKNVDCSQSYFFNATSNKINYQKHSPASWYPCKTSNIVFNHLPGQNSNLNSLIQNFDFCQTFHFWIPRNAFFSIKRT